jgi:FkbM family methyltransferase
MSKNVRRYLPARTLEIPTETHGAATAGYEISPQALSQGSVVYSLGVGSNISFDLSIIQRHGVTVFAFDPTPESAAFVGRSPTPKEFQFRQIGVAAEDGTMELRTIKPGNKLYRPATLLQIKEKEPSTITVKVQSLASIMRDLQHESIDLLKMDIEGGEYGVLEGLLRTSIRPRQIVMEYHPHLINLEHHGHLFGELGWRRTRESIDTLLQAGYRLFHVAEKGMQFSFIRDP